MSKKRLGSFNKRQKKKRKVFSISNDLCITKLSCMKNDNFKIGYIQKTSILENNHNIIIPISKNNDKKNINYLKKTILFEKQFQTNEIKFYYEIEKNNKEKLQTKNVILIGKSGQKKYIQNCNSNFKLLKKQFTIDAAIGTSFFVPFKSELQRDKSIAFIEINITKKNIKKKTFKALRCNLIFSELTFKSLTDIDKQYYQFCIDEIGNFLIGDSEIIPDKTYDCVCLYIFNII